MPEDHDLYVLTTAGPQEQRLFKNGRQITSFLAPCHVAVSTFGIFALDGKSTLWWGDDVLEKGSKYGGVAATEVTQNH